MDVFTKRYMDVLERPWKYGTRSHLLYVMQFMLNSY